jgi:hypothetical protein
MSELWRPEERILILREKTRAFLHVLFISIEQKAIPAMINNKVAGIAFGAVSSANFYRYFVGNTQQRKHKEYYTIFLKLRITPESYIIKRREWFGISTHKIFVVLHQQFLHRLAK